MRSFKRQLYSGQDVLSGMACFGQQDFWGVDGMFGDHSTWRVTAAHVILTCSNNTTSTGKKCIPRLAWLLAKLAGLVL